MSATIDHISISVSDFEKAKRFYVGALKPLGLRVIQDYGTVIGLGSDYPFMWISEGAPGHAHVALRVDTPAEVDAIRHNAHGVAQQKNGLAWKFGQQPGGEMDE